MATDDGVKELRASLRRHMRNPTELLLGSDIMAYAGQGAGLDAAAVLREAHLWPSTVMLSLCCEVSKVGKLQAKLIASHNGKKEISWLEEGNRNNLVDDRISAAAAYSRIFVTNDRFQNHKARYAAAFLTFPLYVTWLPGFLRMSKAELLEAKNQVPEPLQAQPGQH